MIEAKFSIVTPLFMGGADPKVPELRVPGIKGAIRFWWRALAWSWYRGDLGRIRDLEGQIFGSTKDGQSRVIMDLSGVDAKLEKENIFEKLKDQEERCQGLMYLGYGPIDKGKLTRNYLKQPVDATLRIRIRPKGNDKKDPEAPDGSEITDQISKALIAMGYFGGLGSRSRRGFGSFNLTELNVDGRNEFVCPENKDQLGEEIEKFLKGLNRYNGLPEYTAFSPKTEIYIFKNMNTDSLALLGDVGWTMRVYRLGSGNKHSRKFREDTILAKRSLKSKVDEHPRRLFFGLPHNYHFKDLKKNLEIIGENHDRRASPLLIHVQKLGTEYAAVAALMPARFLPPGEKILMRPGKEKNVREGTRIPGMGHHKSPPTSRVELDENEAEELTVIRDFLESWKRVI